jgi:hypothetical protein
MRAVLSLLVLVAFAGTAEAQQQVPTDEPVQAIQAGQDGPRAAQPVPSTLRPVEMPIGGAGTQATGEAGQQQQETRTSDARDVRQQGPSTVQWWWLVGAIVLAGLIIVAIT